MSEFAQSQQVEQELDYWLSLAEGSAGTLPVDYPGGDNIAGSTEVVSVTLDLEETHQLPEQSPQSGNASLHELLLASVVQTLSRWSGETSLLLDLEGLGRDVFVDGIDVSRTVGWFTTMFPWHLRLETDLEPGKVLRSTAEQLRQVPNHGMNYGLLRYLNRNPQIAEQLRNVPQPKIGYLYLGRLGEAGSPASVFGRCQQSIGREHGPLNKRPHLLEIAVQVAGEQVEMSWVFSHNVHRRETVERLATESLKSLQQLLEYCPSGRAPDDTPADFSAKDLSQDDLDRIRRTFARIEAKAQE